MVGVGLYKGRRQPTAVRLKTERKRRKRKKVLGGDRDVLLTPQDGTEEDEGGCWLKYLHC